MTKSIFSFSSVIGIIALLLLGSCANPTSGWYTVPIITKNPSFNSGKMFLEVKSRATQQFEVEIARNPTGLNLYINLLQSVALPLEINPSLTKMVIQLDDQPPLVIYPTLLKGSQRLLIPEDATKLILDHLETGGTLTFTLGRKKGTVTSENFQFSFNELMTIPMEVK